MLEWLAANAATIIIAALLAAIVALAVIKLIKDRKKGISSCGCKCGSCPISGACHKKK